MEPIVKTHNSMTDSFHRDSLKHYSLRVIDTSHLPPQGLLVMIVMRRRRTRMMMRRMGRRRRMVMMMRTMKMIMVIINIA